jgi:hypothetical protein
LTVIVIVGADVAVGSMGMKFELIPLGIAVHGAAKVDWVTV